MKNRKETSTERNNRTAMIAHFSDVTVMSVFWILQALSKVQPWAFVLIALLLGYAPVIAEYYFFQKTHETKAIKHLCAPRYSGVCVDNVSPFFAVSSPGGPGESKILSGFVRFDGYPPCDYRPCLPVDFGTIAL